MRLYQGRVPAIAADVIRTLSRAGDIEVSNPREAEIDVESVLNEYLRTEREINDEAREMLARRGLPHEQFGRARRAIAEQRGLGLGEEAIPWISTQIIEVFMHSQHIDEVYADDGMLRVKLKDLLLKHMALEEEIESEARKRIQNLQEGTTTWEVEYARAMAEIKRARGLD